MSWSGQTRIFIPFFSVRTWTSRPEGADVARFSAARPGEGREAAPSERIRIQCVMLVRCVTEPPKPESGPRQLPILRAGSGYWNSGPHPRSTIQGRERCAPDREGSPRMSKMHEVEYRVLGDDLQYVEIELDPGEAAVAEAGAMMYLEDGIEMTTIFGDGSQARGDFIEKLVGAGKRLLTGESLFMTVFQNQSSEIRHAAFAAPYPGKIQAMNLAELGGELIAQKESFLAAAKGVSIGIAFQKRFGVGLFGGEGFIMERLQGDGMAFVHAGGTLLERELQPGEK